MSQEVSFFASPRSFRPSRKRTETTLYDDSAPPESSDSARAPGSRRAFSILARLLSRPRLERSGPSTPPRPFTMWHSEHFPSPKKNSWPAAASPEAGRSAAGDVKEPKNASSASISASERRNGGMPAAGIPLLMISRRLSFERARVLRLFTISGPRSPPPPSAPWQLAQRASNCLRPASIDWPCPLESAVKHIAAIANLFKPNPSDSSVAGPFTPDRPGEIRIRDVCSRLDRQSSVFCAMLGFMQKWEYKVFASHLDPAELVILLDESGREGWELVTLVAVVEHLPPELIDPAAAAQALNTDEVAEVVPVQAFRYIFKRTLAAL